VICFEAKDVSAGYGDTQVLWGLSLSVQKGQLVALIGANGAGKTTTLRALCGMVDTKGSVQFEGTELVGKPPDWIVRRGVAHVPQGRGTFPELTVEENLQAGAYIRKDHDEVWNDVQRWLEVFPRLGDRRGVAAGSLSGGEQQMLAVARALMSRPKMLLLDEPSLGLAPMVTQELFKRFSDLNSDFGTTMFLVEQNAGLALSIAARAYVLEAGHIVLSGSSDELRDHDDVRKAYLGF
jgi:branched-chain amino acid transport system ATP-binding protein